MCFFDIGADAGTDPDPGSRTLPTLELGSTVRWNRTFDSRYEPHLSTVWRILGVKLSSLTVLHNWLILNEVSEISEISRISEVV